MPATEPNAPAPGATTQAQEQLRQRVRSLCSDFPDTYWRECDHARAYPDAFVDALTAAGLLAVLIPTEYGGSGLGVTEGSIVLEEINRSGGHSAACHAQMYTMGALLKHGSPEQKLTYLPGIADGSVRLQAFSITEAEAGSNTTDIHTTATRCQSDDGGDHYVITGHKNWTSRIEQSDLALVLARTTPRTDDPAERTHGISLFLVDLREVRAEQPDSLVVTPVHTMFNYATNEVHYDGMRVPTTALVGEEGRGFRYVIDGWNAERILLAAEAVGDGYWFVDRAVAYARERVVFDRPIGANQGVAFPLARAYAAVSAADLMRYRAAALFDAGASCGEQANIAKLLASEASWQAGNACLDTHGGYGFVDVYDVERKFRETRLYQVAPVSNNLVLAYVGQHVLGLPRSY